MLFIVGDIAIDDIGVSTGACNNVPIFTDPTAQSLQTSGCTFSSSVLCDGWMNSNWTITNYTTNSPNTGPDVDHTSDGGYYIYAEASRPYKTGDKAILSHVQLPPTQSYSNKVQEGVCIQFW